MSRTAPLFLIALLVGCAPDADGDGVPAAEDCDDTDAGRFPGNDDPVGDGVDGNCDQVDGIDLDRDGVASFASGGTDCLDDDPDSLGADEDRDDVPACLDCDDSRDDVFPGADETCDGRDNDCDGSVDLDADALGVCTTDRAASGALDVLFVVDNSGNTDAMMNLRMIEVATTLRAELAARGTDFHLGTISTDREQGQGRLQTSNGEKWIDAETANPDQLLSNMMQLGTGGAAIERARDCVALALEDDGVPSGFNEGFFRDDGALQIVFLSNEDDMSDTDLAEFTTTIETFGLLPATVHAAVVDQGTCPEAAVPGLDYLALVDQTGGLAVDVCEPDYLPLVDAMLAAAPEPPYDHFLLPADVDVATLTVTVLAPGGGTVAEYPTAVLAIDGDEVVLPAPVDVEHSIELRYARLPVAD